MKTICHLALGLLVLCAVSLIFVSVSRGGTVAPAAPLPQLIQQLADPSYAVRFHAQQKLVDAGAQAVPALKAALLAAQSPILRRRIRRVIFQIDYQAIRRGTLVSLVVNHQTVPQIIKRIQNAVGPEFHIKLGTTVPALSTRRFSFDFRHQPVLEVLHEIAEKAGLLMADPEHVPGTVLLFSALHDDALRVSPRDPFQCDGAFLISARTAIVPRALGAPASGPAGRHLTVYLTLLAEPGAHLAGFPSPPAITAAVDDRGRGRAWPFSHPWPNAFYSTADELFEFQRPIRQWPDHATLLREVRGGMPVRVYVTAADVVFSKPFAGGRALVRHVRLRLGRMYAQDNMYLVRLHYHVPRDGNTPLLSASAQAVVDSFNPMNYPVLTDAAGRSFKAAGYKGKLGMRKGYFQYFYKPLDSNGSKIADRPVRMKMRIYESTRIIRLPFVFRNLKLPSGG